MFLIFISSKNYIFNIYLNFHLIYSYALISIIIIYYYFIVINIFDYKYNENYFFINFIYFSFFNNFILAILLACIFLCIGSIPFILNFYIKLFCLFLYLSYLGISILYFTIIWFIILYMFYFRLIVNIFIFSYQSLGYWVIKIYYYYIKYTIIIIASAIYIIFFDIINIFDLII